MASIQKDSYFSENFYNSVSMIRDEVLPVVDMALPGVDTEKKLKLKIQALNKYA